MKLQVNDKVRVTAGKDKGKENQITKVFPQKNRVLVKGVNKYKRHMKRQSQDQPGGIVEVERPLPVSNVQLVCPVCKKITRIRYQVDKTGDKYRICAKCGALIDKQKQEKKSK